MTTSSTQSAGKTNHPSSAWNSTDKYPTNTEFYKTSIEGTVERDNTTTHAPAWASTNISNDTVSFRVSPQNSTASPEWDSDGVNPAIPVWVNDRDGVTSSWTNADSNATNSLWGSNRTDTASTRNDMTSPFGNISLSELARLIWGNTITTNNNNSNNITTATNSLNDTSGSFLADWNSILADNLTVSDADDYADMYSTNNVTGIGNLTPQAALFRFFTSGLIITVNVLTIVTFCRIRALRTLSNMLTVNLAVADLLVGLIVLQSAFTVVPAFNPGRTECVFRLCWFFVSCCVSMVTICLQGGERYLFIVHPYRHVDFVSAKIIGGFIALSWAIGLSFGMTPYLLEHQYEASLGCDLYFVLGPYHGVYCSIAIFLGTSLLTLVFYSLIARLVLEKRRSIVTVHRPNTSNNSAISTASLSGNNPSSRHASLRSKLLALKAPAVVFGVFFCCWAPHMIGYGLHDAGVLIARQIRVWLTNIGLFNSAMNFFVYLSLNRQFREALSFKASGCCRSTTGTSRRKTVERKTEKAKGRVSPLPAGSVGLRPTTSVQISEVVEIGTTRPPYVVPVPVSVISNNQTAENRATTAAFYSYANPISASCIADDVVCCASPKAVTPTDVVPKNVCQYDEHRLETGQLPYAI